MYISWRGGSGEIKTNGVIGSTAGAGGCCGDYWVLSDMTPEDPNELPIPLLYKPLFFTSPENGKPAHNLIKVIAEQEGDAFLFVAGEYTGINDMRLVTNRQQSYNDTGYLMSVGKLCLRRLSPKLQYHIKGSDSWNRLAQMGPSCTSFPDSTHIYSFDFYNGKYFVNDVPPSRLDGGIGQNRQATKPNEIMVISDSILTANPGFDETAYTDKMEFPIEAQWESGYSSTNTAAIFGNDRYSGIALMSGANVKIEAQRSIDTQIIKDIRGYSRLVVGANEKIYLFDSKHGKIELSAVSGETL